MGLIVATLALAAAHVSTESRDTFARERDALVQQLASEGIGYRRSPALRRERRNALFRPSSLVLTLSKLKPGLSCFESVIWSWDDGLDRFMTVPLTTTVLARTNRISTPDTSAPAATSTCIALSGSTALG